MTQKNDENIYKALKEEERTLSEKNFVWMKKAFKRKENYAALGNMDGKLVFCEGEYPSYLEGFRMIIFRMESRLPHTTGKLKMGLMIFRVFSV